MSLQISCQSTVSIMQMELHSEADLDGFGYWIWDRDELEILSSKIGSAIIAWIR